MMDVGDGIRVRYQQGLHDYLENPGETHLLSAYELGREALAQGLGVIDMVGIHHGALKALWAEANGKAALLQERLGSVAVFFIETLAPFEMVHRGHEESNAALRNVNDSLEEETKRIAQMLHDEAGQLLATAYLELSVTEKALPAVRDHAGRLRASLDLMREHLRRLAHELHPTVLDDLGLGPALQFLADGFTARTGVPVIVEGAIESRLSKAVESALYRSVQEGLANVSRHAKATQVVLELGAGPVNVQCTIQDNGVGFNPRQMDKGHRAGGLGLLGIQDRLVALNGTMTVDSRPGEGARITVTIPLQR